MLRLLLCLLPRPLISPAEGVSPSQDGSILTDTDNVSTIGCHLHPGDVTAMAHPHMCHLPFIIAPDLGGSYRLDQQ